MATQFGDLAKSLRIEFRKTLRTFCSELNFDPSNWSKIERGINPAPKEDILTKIASYFELAGDKLQEFKDLASCSRGELPGDIVSDADILKKMPAFFRNVRNEQTMTEEEAHNMMEDIKKLNTPDAE